MGGLGILDIANCGDGTRLVKSIDSLVGLSILSIISE